MSSPLAAQISEARSNGYSDDEIVNYLGSKHPELAPKIREAKSSGYGSAEIVSHLAPPEPPAKQEPQPGAFAKFFHAVNEFSNPLAAFEPTPGVPFDEKLKTALSSLAEIPHETWKALQASGEAMRNGEISKAAYHLAGAVPLLGPMAQTVARDVENRAPAEALGHAVGMGAVASLANPEAAGAAAADTARAAVKVPGRISSSVKDAVSKPGTLPIVTGAGQVAGSIPALTAGHPFVAGGLALRGLENIKKGVTQRIEAANAPPPLYDEIAKSIGGEKYSNLAPAGQETVRKIAQQMQSEPKATVATPTEAVATEPIKYEPAPGAPRTVQASIEADLERRRSAGYTTDEQAPDLEELIRDDRAALETYRNAQGRSEQPSAPETAPEKPTAQPAASPAESNPTPEAFRSTDSTVLQVGPKVANQNAVADKIATHLKNSGITSTEIDQLEKSNPEGFALFWNNTGQIPGASKQANYSPSPETIAAARDALAQMEGKPRKSTGAAASVVAPASIPEPLRSNPAALNAAKSLADELMKSESPKPAPKKRGKRTTISGLLQTIRDSRETNA